MTQTGCLAGTWDPRGDISPGGSSSPSGREAARTARRHTGASRPAVLVVILTLAAAACGGGGRGTSGGSGIAGTVVSAQGCPAPGEASEPSPNASVPACEERPVAAMVRIVDSASGTVVAETVADENGHFRLELPPGDYEAHVLAEDGTEAGPGVPVAVPPGTMTEVTLQYDTGIR